MRKIILATKNKGKAREIKKIFKNTPFDFISIIDIPEYRAIEVEENGVSFKANALKKAKFWMKVTNMPVIAEDSGLVVDVLGKKPGIYSSRYAGREGSDKKNNEKLIKELRNIPLNKRTARFVCYAVIIFPQSYGLSPIFSRGIVKGFISKRRRGKCGFGYDPLFIVPEYNKTFAQLGPIVKNRISHRSRAFQRLKMKLLQMMTKEQESK